MKGYIDGIEFVELEAMKYYAPPAGWSQEKKTINAKDKIYSGYWLGAEKKDGYFTRFIKDEDGNLFLQSRSRGVNGEFPNKVEWVPHLQSFFDSVPNGTCILGELHLPSKPGSKNITSILGCLKEKAVARQNKGEKLHFYIFDILAWDGKSYLSEPAHRRFKAVELIDHANNPYVDNAKYYKGKDLWMLLQNVLGNGGEGIVITHEDALYEPGKRPSKTTLKIKKELKQTIDCFFTGRYAKPTREYTGKEIKTWTYWQNEVTAEKIEGEMYSKYVEGAPLIPVTKGYFYGWAGSLEIAVFANHPGSIITLNGVSYVDKEIFPIGYLSGLPDKLKASPKEYAWKPIEVTAMEYDDVACTLRHGKMIGWREDLDLGECTLEKIQG